MLTFLHISTESAVLCCSSVSCANSDGLVLAVWSPLCTVVGHMFSAAWPEGKQGNFAAIRAFLDLKCVSFYLFNNLPQQHCNIDWPLRKDLSIFLKAFLQDPKIPFDRICIWEGPLVFPFVFSHFTVSLWDCYSAWRVTVPPSALVCNHGPHASKTTNTTSGMK